MGIYSLINVYISLVDPGVATGACPPPQLNPIFSFSQKSVHVGGLCPPMVWHPPNEKS